MDEQEYQEDFAEIEVDRLEQEFQSSIALCAYKPLDELNEKEWALIRKEKIKCKDSFLYWLKYAKIVEPPTQDNPGGIIKFELWEHLKKAISALLSQKLIVWLKSRQIGASWLISTYDLWYAMSQQGANIMLFSKGEPEAFEKVTKCRRVFSQLPPFLQIKVDPDSAGEMGFPVMMSSIKAFAATKTAGISYTASIIDCDEWAEHPYADENYFSSKPARDAGGQFIAVFTPPDELNLADNLAVTTFQDAISGKNDFFPLFDPYWARPGRDREWYEHTKRNIPDRELAKLTPDLYMARNYPSSIQEALSPIQSITAFDIKVLDEMMGDTRNPIKVVRDGIDPQIVKVYQDFHIGEFYIAASDASHGVGKDFSVTAIMNVKTGCVVADIMNNLLPPEELALHSVRMLDIYRNPLWYPEDNEWGRVIITTAQTLGYKNFGYRDEKKTKVGWHTDEKSRFDLFGGLIPAMNNHQITIYNTEGLKQFYNIIRVASKNGRIEAMGGRHDDYPIAVGICWAKKEEVRIKPFVSKPIDTLHFRHRGSEYPSWIKR